MPDVMKVGGLLRQEVLVTVKGVLPMCACVSETDGQTDRDRDRQTQPDWRKREERDRGGQCCASPSALPQSSHPGVDGPSSAAEEDLSGNPGAILGSGGFRSRVHMLAGMGPQAGGQPAWRQHLLGSLLNPPPNPSLGLSLSFLLLLQGSQREANPGKGSGGSDAGPQLRVQSKLFG